MSDRDLVNELRRVDDAFSRLKPGSDDVVEALLAADPVALGARRPLSSWLGLVGGAGLVAALAVVVLARSSPLEPSSSSPSSSSVSVSVSSPAVAPALAALPAVAPAVAVEARARTTETAAITEIAGSPAATTTTLPAPLRMVEAPRAGVAPRALQPARRVDVDGALVAAPGLSGGRVVARSDGSQLTGIGAAIDAGDEEAELQRSLERARALQARGAYADAADVIALALAEQRDPRVQETLGFEQALLLLRAREPVRACAALAAHAARFPNSGNADDVAAARARLSCP